MSSFCRSTIATSSHSIFRDLNSLSPWSTWPAMYRHINNCQLRMHTDHCQCLFLELSNHDYEPFEDGNRHSRREFWHGSRCTSNDLLFAAFSICNCCYAAPWSPRKSLRPLLLSYYGHSVPFGRRMLKTAQLLLSYISTLDKPEKACMENASSCHFTAVDTVSKDWWRARIAYHCPPLYIFKSHWN